MLSPRLFGPDAPPPSQILVTGGAGFVGHGIARILDSIGLTVRVLDPGPPHPDWPSRINHIRGDLMDTYTLEGAVRGVDLVFHTAGLWDGGPAGKERMRRLNIEGTDKILRLGIPTVYTSSSITCGFGSLERPGTEDEPSEDPQRPLQGTPRVYRETKLEAEALVREARAWMVNPDYVVGPGDVNGVVTQPLLRASSLPVIPAPRGGKCFVSLMDVAAGHLLVLAKGRPGRRYLLGSENRSYADILGTLARLRGRRAAVIGLPRRAATVLKRLPRVGPTGGALEQMGLHRYRSSERARAELEWCPAPIDDALLEMIRWARRAQST